MIIVEAVIIVALIAGGVVLGSRLIKAMSDAAARRAEARRLREERVARLEAAKTAKEVAQEILLDREMALQVLCELEKQVGDGSCKDESD